MQGGDGNNAISGGMASSETIMVPDKMVGLIIGRGGEQVWKSPSTTTLESRYRHCTFLIHYQYKIYKYISRYRRDCTDNETLVHKFLTGGP